MDRKTLLLPCALLALALAPAAGLAGGGSEEWKFTFAPYFVGAGLDGTMVIGDREADLHADFDDILDNLELGGMAVFQARKGRWAFQMDSMYLALGSTVREPAPIDLDVDVNQLMVSVGAAYAATDYLNVCFGARYSQIDQTLRFKNLGVKVSGDVEWVDPYVGFGASLPLSERWRFLLLGDIGGFGIGSDLAWQVSPNLAWDPNDRFSLVLGYRWIDVDYDEGHGANYFEYDVMTQGPQLGLAFHW